MYISKTLVFNILFTLICSWFTHGKALMDARDEYPAMTSEMIDFVQTQIQWHGYTYHGEPKPNGN